MTDFHRLTDFHRFVRRLDEELRGGAKTRQALRAVLSEFVPQPAPARRPVKLHRAVLDAVSSDADSVIVDGVWVRCSCGWEVLVDSHEYPDPTEMWTLAYKAAGEHELGVIETMTHEWSESDEMAVNLPQFTIRCFSDAMFLARRYLPADETETVKDNLAQAIWEHFQRGAKQ